MENNALINYVAGTTAIINQLVIIYDFVVQLNKYNHYVENFIPVIFGERSKDQAPYTFLDLHYFLPYLHRIK